MVTLAFKRRQLGGGPKAKWLKGLSSITYRSFLFIEEYGVQAIISKETKCRCRESDSSVVPMKLGNADGGKAATK